MRLLTRGSALALLQAERMALPLREKGLDVEIVPLSTRGDRDTVSPLCSFGGSGAFSGCIEEALLGGKGDGAVHSLKDVPSCCRDGLEIASVLPRDSAGDVLVSRGGHTLETLAEGAVVGTSSPRRKAQLLRVRPGLSVREIRGNLSTRLKKMEDGLYDALVLAAAGLERMGIHPGGRRAFLPPRSLPGDHRPGGAPRLVPLLPRPLTRPPGDFPLLSRGAVPAEDSRGGVPCPLRRPRPHGEPDSRPRGGDPRPPGPGERPPLLSRPRGLGEGGRQGGGGPGRAVPGNT